MCGPKDTNRRQGSIRINSLVFTDFSRKSYLGTMGFLVIFFYSHFSLFSIFYFGFTVLEVEPRAGLGAIPLSSSSLPIFYKRTERLGEHERRDVHLPEPSEDSTAMTTSLF